MNQKDLIKQAQKLQAAMAKAQQELAEMTVEASAGGGVVKVTITGQQKICAVKIAPEAIDPNDISLLEDLILGAVNEALEKSQNMAQSKMGALTGGFNIPGLM
ncbi:MAG: YbaB/EbfC family nucleoid-associated protein [Chloroflexi bacterium]|nr:YbaB/EbfC family nucleoid-associated protein [Chloroflexota bacterium]